MLLLKPKHKYLQIFTELYVPNVNLLIQDNAKLLQQLKSGFLRTINCETINLQEKNRYVDYLIDPSFPGVNRHFLI